MLSCHIAVVIVCIVVAFLLGFSLSALVSKSVSPPLVGHFWAENTGWCKTAGLPLTGGQTGPRRFQQIKFL